MSTLLLKTDFRSSVTLSSPKRISPNQYWVTPAGIDGKTLFELNQWFKSYFGEKTQFYIQQLPAGSMSSTREMLANIQSTLQKTSISSDPYARELYTVLKKRKIAENPQAPLLIQRRRDDWGGANVTPIKPIPSLYWSYDCILDPRMANFVPGSYMAITETKSGDLPYVFGDDDSNSTSGSGSYRFKLLAGSGTGGNVMLQASCDNNANILDSGTYPENYNAKTGFYFAPFTYASRKISVGDTVRGKTSKTLGTAKVSELRFNAWESGYGKGILVITNSGAAFKNGEVLQIQTSPGVWVDACTVAKFWNGLEDIRLDDDEQKYQVAPDVPAPLGVPLRFEFNIVAPQSRTDLITGITQCAMTNLKTGVRTTICDFRGGIQMGAADDPVMSLIFIMNPYSNFNNESGGAANSTINLAHRFTNLEIRDAAPHSIV